MSKPAEKSTPFNEAAAPGTAAVFDFAQAVAEVYQGYPEIEESVFFIDVTTGQVIHPNDETRDFAQDFIDCASFKEEFGTRIQAYLDKKSSACIDSKSESYIMHYLEPDMIKVLGRAASADAQAFFVFDHELAHAITPRMYEPNRLLHENIADAYATLRHFQRFGMESDSIHALSLLRTMNIILWDADSCDGLHFTSPAVQKVIALKDQVDFTTLDPRQTYELARRVGLETAPQPELPVAIHRCFTAVQEEWKTATDDAPIKTLAKIVLSPDTPPEAAEWGGFLLESFLDGRLSYGAKGTDFKFEGADWDATRQQLKTLQESLAQNSLLVHLGDISAPKAKPAAQTPRP